MYSAETFIDLEDIENPFKQKIEPIIETVSGIYFAKTYLSPVKYELTDDIFRSIYKFDGSAEKTGNFLAMDKTS